MVLCPHISASIPRDEGCAFGRNGCRLRRRQVPAPFSFVNSNLAFNVDAREEQFDNESERASLMSRTATIDQYSSPPSPKRQQGNWVSRLTRRDDGRAAYQPISGDE